MSENRPGRMFRAPFHTATTKLDINNNKKKKTKKKIYNAHIVNSIVHIDSMIARCL